MGSVVELKPSRDRVRNRLVTCECFPGNEDAYVAFVDMNDPPSIEYLMCPSCRQTIPVKDGVLDNSEG